MPKTRAREISSRQARTDNRHARPKREVKISHFCMQLKRLPLDAEQLFQEVYLKGENESQSPMMTMARDVFKQTAY